MSAVKKAAEVKLRQVVIIRKKEIRETLNRILGNQRLGGGDYARAAIAISYALLIAEQAESEIKQLEDNQ